MTTIKVSIKNVYGNELIYPANDVANRLTDLMGKKTFSRSDLRKLQLLNFDVEVVTPVLV